MGWLWLGLVLGLLIGAAAVGVGVRAVGRVTGADLRGVGRLVVDGLTPGRRSDGVAAQRALARRLKRAGQRTASGRRVAADELAVHVSPEDHEVIGDALGIDAAQADLAEFYRGIASRGGWIVGREPSVRLVRDISLRPRQSFVTATTRAPSPRAPAPVGHPQTDSVTAVLPSAMLEDTSVIAVHPGSPALGDLVIVHGTDVRTIPATEGVLRIGRGPHNDLVLERPGVGRDHLVIEARTSAWWIVPGTSQGETLLNGSTMEGPVPIAGTASIEIGRGVRLRVSVEPS